MIKQHIGVQSIGIQCPMFKEGDNLPSVRDLAEETRDATQKITDIFGELDAQTKNAEGSVSILLEANIRDQATFPITLKAHSPRKWSTTE